MLTFCSASSSDPSWFDWSARRLERVASNGIAINPVIYAELGAGFRGRDELDAALSVGELRKLELPCEAAFRAGRAFIEYRRRGGTRHSTLPDLFIGAHAETAGLRLLTRDARRYRTYVPELDVIAPGIANRR